MNHITEALDLIMQNQLVALLCVAVVFLIAGIALMVGYERAENKAADALERERIGQPPSWMK